MNAVAHLRPQGAIAVAVAIAMLAAILGVKTSLQAASSSKPFSMEGFEKKGKGGGAGGGGGGDGAPIEPHERDTTEQDAPNGDWLTDPMCVFSFLFLSHLHTCFVLFFFKSRFRRAFRVHVALLGGSVLQPEL